MKRFVGLLFVVAAVFSCVGTKGPPLESDVYSLEYPGPETAAAVESLPVVIRVDAFDAPIFLGTDRMAYREKPYVVDTYRYHRWQAPPAQLVAWHLERDLRSVGFCKAVIGSDSLLQATHVLEGTVDEFFENDAQTGWEAVLSVSLTLSANRTASSGRRILMQRRYSARHPCRYRNPLSLAEAMSLAMADVSARALTDIYEQLAAER
ncbi:MAG: ABC-type transport auxiliary lipoprotein family protein [Desulfobacterales bacterium]|jgi:cholesterol transport system auxiliary component